MLLNTRYNFFFNGENQKLNAGWEVNENIILFPEYTGLF